MIATVWLALPVPPPTPLPERVDPAIVTPGLRGFLVVLALGLATWLLLLSLSRRLKRLSLPSQPPAQVSQARPAADDEVRRPGQAPAGESRPGMRP